MLPSKGCFLQSDVVKLPGVLLHIKTCLWITIFHRLFSGSKNVDIPGKICFIPGIKGIRFVSFAVCKNGKLHQNTSKKFPMQMYIMDIKSVHHTCIGRILSWFKGVVLTFFVFDGPGSMGQVFCSCVRKIHFNRRKLFQGRQEIRAINKKIVWDIWIRDFLCTRAVRSCSVCFDKL